MYLPSRLLVYLKLLSRLQLEAQSAHPTPATDPEALARTHNQLPPVECTMCHVALITFPPVPAAIPSLRARDCPEKEKEALNYLFLLVPLINITLPLVWKSFAAVYTADVTVFLSMYAWKVRPADLSNPYTTKDLIFRV